MLCTICGIEFEKQHFNQKYCCEYCKKQAIKNSREKYKSTDKGKKSNEKWISSEKRKENEKRYRQNPVARHKAVLRSIKFLQNNKEALQKKRERDRVYGQSEKGRAVNNKAQKKYKQSEKGKINNRKQKYQRRTNGNVDKNYVEKLFNGEICYYCKQVITDKKTIDHKTPVSKGGNNDNENLVLACLHCNTQKGNKNEEEYERWKNENNL